MEDKPLFVCYSLPLRDFLFENGIRYEVGGKSINTDKPFWVYVRCEKLNTLLNTWSSRRPA